MTIRSGGRPRDARAPHAHPYDPDAYATEAIPPYSEPVKRSGRNGRGSGGGGGGIGGIVKFLVFALVLGGIVLAVALTALRPLVNKAILDWAQDNPAALSMPFVHDIVAEDIGPAMTRAASTDPAQVEFVVQSGDTPGGIASKLGVPAAQQQAWITQLLQQNNVTAQTLQIGQTLTTPPIPR